MRKFQCVVRRCLREIMVTIKSLSLKGWFLNTFSRCSYCILPLSGTGGETDGSCRGGCWLSFLLPAAGRQEPHWENQWEDQVADILATRGHSPVLFDRHGRTSGFYSISFWAYGSDEWHDVECLNTSRASQVEQWHHFCRPKRKCPRSHYLHSW